ncbi:hypothetical protein K7X08_003439 [Anisodus acutangulus]|uniref:Uncharacterized protein n=1 Tax=Anisodus acutangulus TaxID=402998 RepID=A0A9Q1RJN8_9SOLA|nr:hypothetical protein K7X08_003439 [Anisodus acutangulus]
MKVICCIIPAEPHVKLTADSVPSLLFSFSSSTSHTHYLPVHPLSVLVDPALRNCLVFICSWLNTMAIPGTTVV